MDLFKKVWGNFKWGNKCRMCRTKRVKNYLIEKKASYLIWISNQGQTLQMTSLLYIQA